MLFDNSRYRGWKGPLRSPWFASLAIVRVALIQVFRRRSYWFVFGLAFVQFMLFWSIIYTLTQFASEAGFGGEGFRYVVFERLGFSPEPNASQESGYISFMDRQGLVTMILLMFSGGLLVGADFRHNSLPFYLSRRIDRTHYVFGKLLAVATIVALVTVAPALLLFLEYGMFTSSTDYWSEHFEVVLAILGYGLVLCVSLSIALVAISAWLERSAPIAVTWSSLFLVLGRLGDYLYSVTGHESWRLLDPWRDIRYVGRLFFGVFEDASRERLAWMAIPIVLGMCLAGLSSLAWRVKSVEVVA